MPKPKSRGNGQGTAYKRGKTWTAQVVIGWRVPDDPARKPIPIKRTKGGFPSKRDAIAGCALLYAAKPRERSTLMQVYSAWEASYAARVQPGTMTVYGCAFKHFKALYGIYMDLITARDLQDCLDACPSGKRTRDNMRTVAGMLWGYAMDANIVDKDITNNLYTGKSQAKQREPLTEDEVETIRKAIPAEPYAEYVYALCYLGFRPGEFLALKKTDLHEEDGLHYLVGGSKTDAGRNRRVPVPQVIMPIIQRRMKAKGTDMLFPRLATNRRMTHQYFREHVFKPLMARLGIAEGKVPYSARHTYSDKLKLIAGDDKAKAAIMGHTDYSFTRQHYQSVTNDDLKTIVDGIK